MQSADDGLDDEGRAALAQRAKRRRAEPMSVEEKMREQATRAEMGRPVFMSKAQREAAAAEVEAEAAELDELMQEAERAQRQEYMAKVRDDLREQRETVRRNAYGGGGGGGPSSSAAGASSSSAKAEPPRPALRQPGGSGAGASRGPGFALTTISSGPSNA